MLATVLAVLLIIALIASVPAWPYSLTWGYYPSGTLSLILIVLLILLFTKRI
jgi:hypothetical protein